MSLVLITSNNSGKHLQLGSAFRSLLVDSPITVSCMHVLTAAKRSPSEDKTLDAQDESLPKTPRHRLRSELAETRSRRTTAGGATSPPANPWNIGQLTAEHRLYSP